MPGTSVKDAIKKFEETLATVRQIYEEYPDKISDHDPLLLVDTNKGCESTADCKKVTISKKATRGCRGAWKRSSE